MYLRSSVLLAMLAWCCATPLVVLPPQEASPTLLLALPSQELEGPKTIGLDKFTWTVDEPAEGGLRVGNDPVAGKLEVCTETDLTPDARFGPSDDEETIHIVIMLSDGDGKEDGDGIDDTLKEYQGKITTGKCAEFDLASNPISKESVKFTMVTKSKDDSVIRKGSATFSLQLTSVHFSCNGKDVVRINQQPKDVDCFPVSDLEAHNGLCYVEGSTITAEKPLCVTVAESEPTGVVVCQTYVEGKKLEDKPFSDFSLLYSQNGEKKEKSLSYTYADIKGGDSSEVLVTVGAITKVYFGCSGTECLLDVEPNDEYYEVCALSLNDLEPSATAVGTGKIQDCNLISYNDDGMMEFGFNNYNSNPVIKVYEAQSFDDDLAVTGMVGSVTMDCTGVDEEKTCYGFLDVADILKTGKLELTYDVGAIKNKIVTPFTNVNE